MTVTVLATALADAVGKDETPENGGCDLSAGMFGPDVSAWLRQVAEELDRARREAAAYRWAYGYLQDRMRSVGRDGWAQDCDSEIESRVLGAHV